MKSVKLFILMAAMIYSSHSYSQVVFNDTAIMVINDCYLVINNKDSNGILETGGGGLILTDDENDIVKWNVESGAGTYTIPFGTSSLERIPFIMDITTIGFKFGGGGNYLFKTYPTGVANTPWPTGVTGISHVSGANDSAYMADRYWLIEPNNYTAFPVADYTFTYEDPVDIKVGNTITEGNLQAQYWTGSTWYIPKGVVNTTANTVVVDDIDWAAPWVLTDNSSPLPVELLFFDAEWTNSDQTEVLTSWATAMEIDNDRFEVERSINGIDFQEIGEMASKGNSSTKTDYTWLDEDPIRAGFSYYRLKQINLDGSFEYSNIVVLANRSNSTELVNLWPNPASAQINVMMNVNQAQGGMVNVYGVDGRLFKNQLVQFREGANVLTVNTLDLSAGEYFFQVVLDDNQMVSMPFIIEN